MWRFLFDDLRGCLLYVVGFLLGALAGYCIIVAIMNSLPRASSGSVMPFMGIFFCFGPFLCLLMGTAGIFVVKRLRR